MRAPLLTVRRPDHPEAALRLRAPKPPPEYRAWAALDPYRDNAGCMIRVVRRPSSLVRPPTTQPPLGLQEKPENLKWARPRASAPPPDTLPADESIALVAPPEQCPAAAAEMAAADAAVAAAVERRRVAMRAAALAERNSRPWNAPVPPRSRFAAPPKPVRKTASIACQTDGGTRPGAAAATSPPLPSFPTLAASAEAPPAPRGTDCLPTPACRATHPTDGSAAAHSRLRSASGAVAGAAESASAFHDLNAPGAGKSVIRDYVATPRDPTLWRVPSQPAAATGGAPQPGLQVPARYPCPPASLCLSATPPSP
jgi:hypothetical protein